METVEHKVVDSPLANSPDAGHDPVVLRVTHEAEVSECIRRP